MEIEPLPYGFGAEVTGFDAQRGGTPQEIAALRAAYEQWSLLVFRDCGPLAPARQVEITGWFGPTGANCDEQGRPWTVLHNADAIGSEELPFHCDITFLPHPLEGISLHPQALPRVPTSTTFVSNAVAWDALPPALQDEIRDLRARHRYDRSADLDLDWPVLEHWHPVCLQHPKTKRPLLFVTEHHVDRIGDVSEARSAELLRMLFAELYAPHRRYEHVWCLGDLVIWDNRCTMHAATPLRSNAYRRDMRRTTINESGPETSAREWLELGAAA